MTTAARKISCHVKYKTIHSNRRSSFLKRRRQDTESAKNGCLTRIQYLKIRHILDAMHCEKNFYKNVMKTIWGLKDTLKVWLDMAEAEIRSDLHAVEGGPGGAWLLPQAPYVLSREEKALFVKIIRDLKTPSNYVG